MNIKTREIDSANVTVTARVHKSDIDERVDAMAVDAGKQMKVDGFRKGKVPKHIVKKMHGEQLEKDAEAEAIRESVSEAYKKLEITQADVIGEPLFKKYEWVDNVLETEIQLCLKPNVELGDYSKIIPSFEEPTATTQEVHERVAELAKKAAPLESITEERALAEGDTAVFDFEGFLGDEPFEGGKADDYQLEIGTKQFIEGFEDQMVGMKTGENKRITVTFPEDYQAENLKGQKAEFDVTLKDIKVKAELEIDDALAQKITGQEDATVEILKDRIVDQIKGEKVNKLYNEELKPKLLEALIAEFTFNLPENIVEQEIDNLVNQKAQTMTPDEIKAVQEDTEKLESLRDEVREDANSSVRATFIVDAMAKAEKVTVEDQEMHQALYYEAMMAGQKPEDAIEHYKKNNLFPAMKMGMIEDKLFGKLLGLDKQK